MFFKSKLDCSQKWNGYTLVQPCVSVGLVGQLAVDFLLNNISDTTKVGYFYDKCFMPIVGADPFSKDNSSDICSSCEVYESKLHKLVIVQQRAPFYKGSIPSFRRKLIEWMKNCCFKQILILGSCSSHIKNDADLERTNLRYLASEHYSELEKKFNESFQWEKFNHTRPVMSDQGNASELFIPGGGILKSLYDECCGINFPVVAVLTFSSGGIGTQDSLNLVQGVVRLLSTLSEGEPSIKDLPGSWRIPSSWSGLSAMSDIPRSIQAIY